MNNMIEQMLQQYEADTIYDKNKCLQKVLAFVQINEYNSR